MQNKYDVPDELETGLLKQTINNTSSKVERFSYLISFFNQLLGIKYFS